MATRARSVPSELDRPSKYHLKRMSFEEYLALPEEKPYLEYRDGVALQKAVPSVGHGRLQFWIGPLISEYSNTAGGAVGGEIHRWFEGHGEPFTGEATLTSPHLPGV